ncbi:MAG: hypothetical protein IT449_15895 [Phycisphaerales bacterium]|nr:hypothetical protein [Phycisphaerales bacterium]
MSSNPAQLNIRDLPLRWRTSDAWGSQVLKHPLALLNDHAHLEKKAAANALELLNRWPEPCPPENWVQAMTAVARDEVEHLALVVRLLARRGGRLTRTHANPYAAALRDLVRHGRGPLELIDRLLVSALIELRSCERFEILARCCDDAQLARVYRGLWASEAGHYLSFLGLARALPDATRVDERWEWMLDRESRIIASQPPGPRMHGGI